MNVIVPIPWKLRPNSIEQLLNSLSFVDSAIQSFSIANETSEVHLIVDDKAETSVVVEKVKAMIDRHRPLRDTDLTKVAFEHNTAIEGCSNAFDQLVARGDLFDHGDGVFTLRGQFLQVFRLVEQKVLAFAQTQGAEDVELPVTTALGPLNQSGFFKRTPQFARFMSSLPSDVDRIFEVANQLESTDRVPSDCKLEPPRHICRSAICLSSYPQFAGRVLSPQEFTTWTVFGRAFRNEGSNLSTLERLSEFSMRELIYFGDRDFVAMRLEECSAFFKRIMIEGGLCGKIQTANDPFFAESIRALQFYQFAEQSKWEIRLLNPDSGNDVSVGSINNHGSHFTKSFDIRLLDGSFATTGCVGFGYERLVYLAMCQHGINLVDWPDAVRAFWGL